uniref:Try2 n=1 Tax=Pediculus humanus subsp. corporis TaxID=121224 RepID=Q4VSI2_PEDHC|nr:Try2 [Pediculus humanus corporis]
MICIKIFWALLAIFFSKFGNGEEFRIIGGRKATTLEFPYQVELEMTYMHMCGGSIISNNFILTAAHCVKSVENYKKYPATVFRLRVGADSTSKGGVIYNVEKVICHEKYREEVPKDEFDIALVKTTEPIKFTDNIKPIELVSKEPSEGDMAYVTGYGREQIMRSGMLANHLMAVELPVVGLKKCKKKLKGVANDMICAGFEKGNKDACVGDSGGPMAVNNKLAGVVAWGKGCGQEGVPGVYTNVAHYRKWIDTHMKENS